MQRSHSRHSYPADKPIPVEVKKYLGKQPDTFWKKFHNRKSKYWLKTQLRNWTS